MISPTGRKVRKADKWGEGEYGVKRGNKIHQGSDYICKPDQDVVAPIEGVVIRKARPYRKGPYSGLLIQGKHMAIKMFYVKPLRGIVKSHVYQGDKIGQAQDISLKYPGMIPHIHVRIDSVDPEILTHML